MGRSQGGLSKLPQSQYTLRAGQRPRWVLSAVICGHVPPVTRGRHVTQSHWSGYHLGLGGLGS